MDLPFVGDAVNSFVAGFLSVVATIFVLAICIGIVALIVVYIVDVTQTKQAMQCNKNTCPTGITTHDPKLQRGLDPTNKAKRVSNFQDQIEHEVGIIAHSCGVKEPRQLRRFHCRVVQENGRSIPLNEIYPDQCPAEPITA
jgi:glutamate synthase domain-containing protein 2